MDKIAQRVLATLIGIAAILYSAQITPAAADNSPNQIYSTGKYQMQMSSLWADSKMNWYILVWDTETGRSKMYQANGGNSSGFSCPGSAWSPPSSPLD